MERLAVLAVVLPLVAAALITAGHRWLPRIAVDGVAIATAPAVAAAAAVLTGTAAAEGPIVTWFGAWMPRDGAALGIGFAVDAFGAGFALLIALLMTVVLIFSRAYWPEVGALFHVLMLIFLGATAGYCMTGDLFNLYVFFELISVTAFALTAYRLEQASLHGALNFAVTNTLGGFMILSGLGLLYGHAGAINMAEVGRILAEEHGGGGVVTTAFALMLGGFLVKAAALPFHFWLADAYAVAAMPVCVLFGGASVTLGVFGAARVYWTVFADSALPQDALQTLLLGLGLATALFGGALALADKHLKRMLAFTTISHVGVLLVGMAVMTAEALAGAALYLVGHALVKAALFIGAGVLFIHLQAVNEDALRGRGKDFVVLAAIFIAGGLLLAGAPPGAAYAGKAMIGDAAHGAGWDWAVTALSAASVLGGAAVLRAAWVIFFAGPREPAATGRWAASRPTVVMNGLGVGLIVAAMMLGLAPGIEDAIRHGAIDFTGREAYAARVLDAAPWLPGALPESGKESHLADGLIAGLAAVALAAVAAWWHVLPGLIRHGAETAMMPAVRQLQRLHSGEVGDYVAWFMVGMVTIAGVLVI